MSPLRCTGMKSSPTSSSTECICSGKNTVDSVCRRKRERAVGVRGLEKEKGNDMYNNLQNPQYIRPSRIQAFVLPLQCWLLFWFWSIEVVLLWCVDSYLKITLHQRFFFGGGLMQPEVLFKETPSGSFSPPPGVSQTITCGSCSVYPAEWIGWEFHTSTPLYSEGSAKLPLVFFNLLSAVLSLYLRRVCDGGRDWEPVKAPSIKKKDLQA